MVNSVKKVKLSILSLRKNVNDAHILVYVSMYNVMVRCHLLRYVYLQIPRVKFPKIVPSPDMYLQVPREEALLRYVSYLSN